MLDLIIGGLPQSSYQTSVFVLPHSFVLAQAHWTLPCKGFSTSTLELVVPSRDTKVPGSPSQCPEEGIRRQLKSPLRTGGAKGPQADQVSLVSSG